MVRKDLITDYAITLKVLKEQKKHFEENVLNYKNKKEYKEIIKDINLLENYINEYVHILFKKLNKLYNAMKLNPYPVYYWEEFEYLTKLIESYLKLTENKKFEELLSHYKELVSRL